MNDSLKKFLARNTATIYTLSDPRSGEIRYVGKTTDSLSGRLRNHKNESKKTRSYKNNWVASLLVSGVCPVIEELEKISSFRDQDWQDAERFWISYLRMLGFRLVNSESGGWGGKKMSPETRLKMSMSKVGKKQSAQHVENNRLARKGKKLSPEKLAALTVRWNSPEVRAKKSAALTGRKFSAERKANISKAKKAAFAARRAMK